MLDLQNQPGEDLMEGMSTMLLKLNKGIKLIPKTKAGRKISVEREKGGTYSVYLDPKQLDADNFDERLAEIVSKVERIEFESDILNDPNAGAELKLYKERSADPTSKFFYQVLFEASALHKGSVRLPLLRERLADIGKKSLSRLAAKTARIPLHIQFLLGVTGVHEGLEDEVLEAVQDLRSSGVLGSVFHIHSSEAKRLQMMNQDIYPLYRYFLERDKKEWTAEKPEKPADVQEKTREAVEEVEKQEEEPDQPPSPPNPPEPASEDEEQGEEESAGGDSDEKDTPNDTSDYNPDDTGDLEDDPSGKGYKIEIFPPLKGYYGKNRKSAFIASNLTWKTASHYSIYDTASELEEKKYTMKSSFRGAGVKNIPIPKGYALDPDSLQLTQGTPPQILRDQFGNFFFKIGALTEFSIDFAKEKNPFIKAPDAEDIVVPYQGLLSGKTEAAISQIRASSSDPIKLAKQVRDHIRKNHKYPSGKGQKGILNSAKQLQQNLRTSSNAANYFQNLDASEFLECYSANTLMVALLRKLGIESRMVFGHHVMDLDEQGNAVINESNGHGWCEIWNGKDWIRFDATPDLAKDTDDEKEDKSEKEDDKSKNQKSEEAEDGGEDTPSDEGGEDEAGKEGEKGEGEGEGNGEESEEGGGGEEGESKGGGGGGENEQKEYAGKDFDPTEEFNKMYDELRKSLNEDSDGGDVEKAAEQKREEAQELMDEKNRDPLEQEIRKKIAGLNNEELARAVEFVKYFLDQCKNIERIPNPNAGRDPFNPMLIDVLRSILDRVISRSIKKEENPRYPVSDGEILIDPVTLYFDEHAGLSDSQVWQTTEFQELEKINVVKIRRRKILDGSGSMLDAGKLDLQQLIEVLENKVSAEKQLELDALSKALNRDLRLETETWQFGVMAENMRDGFRRLKVLSPEFDLLEQALTWHLAGQTGPYGTNDYDPLEAIYNELVTEEADQKSQRPSEPSVLERIAVGFLDRELKNLDELSQKEDLDLAPNERIYLKNLRANKASFEKRLSDLKEQYVQGIDPIIEIIEVSTDGGSGNPTRVQTIISKLRSMGVIVIAYGLGADGGAVEKTYKNAYNPLEGGYPCINLLDYPRRKMEAWGRILDRIQ